LRKSVIRGSCSAEQFKEPDGRELTTLHTCRRRVRSRHEIIEAGDNEFPLIDAFVASNFDLIGDQLGPGQERKHQEMNQARPKQGLQSEPVPTIAEQKLPHEARLLCSP